MNNMTYYQGSDGHVKVLGDNELQHWKYIKKIGNQYFYSMEALQAYYRHQQRMANAEYAADRTKDKANQMKRAATIRSDYESNKRNGFSDAKKQYEVSKKLNKAVYDTQGTYRKAKKTVKPMAKTAKRAVTPIDPKREAQRKIDKILNQPPRRKKPTPTRRHNTVKPSRYRQYTAASRW